MKQNNIFNSFSVKMSSFKDFILVSFFICFLGVADSVSSDNSKLIDDHADTTIFSDNRLEPSEINYPPPPADRMQLPQPIQAHIQIIVDFCNIDYYHEQVSKAKEALTGLRKAIPFYTKNYAGQVSFAKLNGIYVSLFGTYIDVFWEYLSPIQRRVNIVDEFLLQHRIMYNLPDGGGPEHLRFDWAKDLYTGLFCLTYGYTPPKYIASKLQKNK